jgi:hypothetical protein
LTFRVVRVGNGSSILTQASAPVFVEERKLDGSVFTNAVSPSPIALPATQSPTSNALTLAGGNTNVEGSLSRSGDGHFVTLAGYAASSGTQNIAGTDAATVSRVVGRIDALGNVNTSTLLGAAYDQSNPRGATTDDGTQFWTSGSGNQGGIWTAALGATSGTQVVTNPSSVRVVHVANHLLYGDSVSQGFGGVFSVNPGLPTSSATATIFPGNQVNGGSAYGFALFDLDPNVAGPDTLYIADDRQPAVGTGGGGIQKWTFNGTTWALIWTAGQFQSGNIPIFVGARGLAGWVTDPATNTVTLIASSADSPTKLLKLVDAQGSSVPTGTVIASATTNEFYRGVAFSPN